MADRDSRSHHRRGYRTAIAIVGVMTAKNRIMICAFIFDLDNCLAAACEVGEDLYEPALEAIRRANRGVISSTVLNSAFEDMWRYPLDWVAARYGFSQEMLEAGWEIFSKLDVKGKLHGYGDAPILSELDGKRFLVTSGFRRLQESKIAALNLTHLFTGIYVDAIDEANRLGKLGIFAHILEAHGLTAAEVLVVGDNADSEIAAGNRLGMPTAQILRPGVLHATNATFHIHSLNELKDLAAHWC
jgi:FMN phosphatase YigB (HAD superfamily)